MGLIQAGARKPRGSRHVESSQGFASALGKTSSRLNVSLVPPNTASKQGPEEPNYFQRMRGLPEQSVRIVQVTQRYPAPNNVAFTVLGIQ